MTMTFEQLGLSQSIVRALADEKYLHPTPIQAGAIPKVLEGKDVCGIAQTGTGKTAAFSLPLLHLLGQKATQGKRIIRALVVTPTRELAHQVEESVRTYGKYGQLRSCVIYGGVGQGLQVQALQKGVDILIATPGRLLDLHDQGYIDFSHVEILVLDEADKMLDMGFLPAIRQIVPLLPKKRQTLLFSATMPKGITHLVQSLMNDYERVEVTPPSSTAQTVRQFVYHVRRDDKMKLLSELLEDPSFSTVLVFTRTKYGADKVAKFLNKSGIPAEAIHGDKSQSARRRALDNFKKWKTKVLVATDVAARGLDIDNISHVINVDIPHDPETYVHRIGRTCRAGMKGIAISFCDLAEAEHVGAIQKLIGKEIEIVYDHALHLQIPEKFFGVKKQPEKREQRVKRGKTPHYAEKKKKFYGTEEEKKQFAQKPSRFGKRARAGRDPKKEQGESTSYRGGKLYAPDYAGGRQKKKTFHTQGSTSSPQSRPQQGRTWGKKKGR